MTRWEAAWEDKSIAHLAACYAPHAVVLHPNKPVILGRDAIGAFFAGGLDRITLVFRRTELSLKGEMAFEWGAFDDVDRGTGAVIATGSYVVTWVRTGDDWHILCHSWNSLRP
jgi:ketosteroid isomerase-like protein